MTEQLPPPEDDPNRETKRLLYLAVVVAAMVAILHFTPVKQWMDDLQGWKNYADQFGWKAHVAFILGSVAAIAVGVPRLLLALAAGALFGFAEGFAVGMISSLGGSYAAFLTARRGSSQKLLEKLHASDSIRRLLAKPSVLNIFFVRQLPVPALVPNVLLGLVKTPHRKFLLGTFLGYLPSNGIVASMGSAMGKDDATKAMWQVTWGMAGLAVVTLLIIIVRKKLSSETQE